MLRGILVTTALALGVTGSVSATPFVLPPPCATDTLASYVLLGSAGCSIGEVGFTGFSFSVIASGGGAVPLTASAITVTPTLDGVRSSLTFSSTGFSVVGSEFVTYQAGYTADPHPIIHGFDNALVADSPTFPGLVSITTDLCLGAAFTGTSCLAPGVPDSVNVFHNGVTTQLFDATAFAPLAVLGVLNTIDLQANGANADFDSFTNTTVLVPEPAGALLIASGLLGLGLLRPRVRGPTARR
jgi:hypothetical protein